MINFIVWAVLLVVFIIIELETIELRAIWFALGSAFALVVYAIPGIGHHIWLQVIVFLLVSILSMYFIRPIAKRHLKIKKTPTNADRSVGEIGVVEEEIINAEGKGLVNVGGKRWSARAEKNEKIPAGVSVEVLRIEGVKVIVKTQEISEQ